MVLNMIDLTTLEGMDTEGQSQTTVLQGSSSARCGGRLAALSPLFVFIPICVALAKKDVDGSGIKVASVATAFPSGNSSLAIKLEDVKMAVDQGPMKSIWSSRGASFTRAITSTFTMKLPQVKEACGDGATESRFWKRASWERSTKFAMPAISRSQRAPILSRHRPAKFSRPRRCRSRWSCWRRFGTTISRRVKWWV